MMGVFVQLNASSRKRHTNPVGYVIAENGCWDWVGGLMGGGYGAMTDGGRTRLAHRVLYERTRGPVPDGMQLDHLCRNRACVNPDHLEAVTQRTNLLRGVGLCAQNAAKTHCRKGHALVPGNLDAHHLKRGLRWCRTCRNERDRQRRLAVKQFDPRPADQSPSKGSLVGHPHDGTT